MMEALKKFSSSSLFLPLVALAVLILFNVVFVDDFLTIQMTEDGRLYGRLVDILTRSSSLIILALGMTYLEWRRRVAVRTGEGYGTDLRNEPEAFRGSAIFIHAAREDMRGTAGCVALKRGDLAELAKRLVPGMVIDIGYAEEAAKQA